MFNDNFFFWMSYYLEDWFFLIFVFFLFFLFCIGCYGYCFWLFVLKELKWDGLVRVWKMSLLFREEVICWVRSESDCDIWLVGLIFVSLLWDLEGLWCCCEVLVGYIWRYWWWYCEIRGFILWVIRRNE